MIKLRWFQRQHKENRCVDARLGHYKETVYDDELVLQFSTDGGETWEDVEKEFELEYQ